MLFTPNQIQELLSIIDKYTVTFLAKKVGTTILSQEDKQRLSSFGVSYKDINSADSNVEQAFKFGLLSDAIGHAAAKSLSYDKFKNMIQSGTFIPLNNFEKRALESVKYQTYNDIKGLTGKMKQDFSSQLVFADKKLNQVRHSKTVTQIAARAIEHRKGVQQMTLELGKMTGQWNKDLGRISDYVLHTAFDEGRAYGFERRNGIDALVYKDVYPGACRHCQKHYLSAGIGSMPKIFKLSELKANGTNVGRKAIEYKPVVGPLHPWCRCTLERVPLGFTEEDLKNGIWEWDGSQFVKVKGAKPTRRVQRTSKVKVTVNNQTVEV